MASWPRWRLVVAFCWVVLARILPTDRGNDDVSNEVSAHVHIETLCEQQLFNSQPVSSPEFHRVRSLVS
jgi:hypothetical protein